MGKTMLFKTNEGHVIAAQPERVYLAGPITGLSYEEAVGWRRRVAEQLPPWITTMSPMRGKQYLADGGAISLNNNTHSLSTDMAITCRDRNDVKRASAVLMNMIGFKGQGLGCAMEIGWADAYGIPLIMVADDDSPWYNHPMVVGTTGYRTNNLDEGIHLMKCLLSVDQYNPDSFATPSTV